MLPTIFRGIAGVLKVLLWLAAGWLAFGLMGALRWLAPGAEPTTEAMFALAMRVVLLFGVFTTLYVYETFFGKAYLQGTDAPLAGSHRDANKADRALPARQDA